MKAYIIACCLFFCMPIPLAVAEKVFTLNRHDQDIGVYDTDTSVMEMIHLPKGYSYKMALSPDGSRLFGITAVVSEYLKNIFVFDTLSNSLVQSIEVRDSYIVGSPYVSPDGQRLYIPSKDIVSLSYKMLVFNAVTFERLNDIVLPCKPLLEVDTVAVPQMIAFSSDSSKLVILNEHDLTVYDVKSNLLSISDVLVDYVDSYGEARSVKFNPTAILSTEDGRYVYIAATSSEDYSRCLLVFDYIDKRIVRKNVYSLNLSFDFAFKISVNRSSDNIYLLTNVYGPLVFDKRSLEYKSNLYNSSCYGGESSYDGKLFFSGTAWGVYVWDAFTLKAIKKFGGTTEDLVVLQPKFSSSYNPVAPYSLLLQ